MEGDKVARPSYLKDALKKPKFLSLVPGIQRAGAGRKARDKRLQGNKGESKESEREWAGQGWGEEA